MQHMTRTVLSLTPLGFLILLTGCGHYTTPGRGADLNAVGLRDSLTESSIKQVFDRKPVAAFPVAIAVVRLQAPGYRSRTAEGFGAGRYSIVTTRDVETPEQFQRLGKLPLVLGIAPVNRLLFPRNSSRTWNCATPPPPSTPICS